MRYSYHVYPTPTRGAESGGTVTMILTTLFAYATPLFPSAQVWCGDRYIEAVRAMLREHNTAFDDSEHENIQLQLLR